MQLTKNFLKTLLCITVMLTCSIIGLPKKADALQRPSDIAVVLDLSSKMGRGGAQRYNDFFKWLEEFTRDSDRIAVVRMGYATRLALPLSPANEFDPKSVRSEISGRERFTDVSAGLENAFYELRTNGNKNHKKIIVLYSDPKIEMIRGRWELSNTMRHLTESLIPSIKNEDIQIMGIIPAHRKKANFALMQELTSGTNGVYFRGFPDNPASVRADLLNVELKKPDTQKKDAKTKTELAQKTPPEKSATLKKTIKASPEKTAHAVAPETKEDLTLLAGQNITSPAPDFTGLWMLTAIIGLGVLGALGFMIYFVKTNGKAKDTDDDYDNDTNNNEISEMLTHLKSLRKIKEETVENLKQDTLEEQDEEDDFGEPTDELSVSMVSPFLDYSNLAKDSYGYDEITSIPAFTAEEDEETNNLSLVNMETLIGATTPQWNKKQ